MSTYTIEFVVPEGASLKQAGETIAVAVHEDEYLLAAARQAGLWLPADCQQGWCTTCAVKLCAGEVDHGHAKRYFDVDEEADFVLACTARPRSDCRVVVCAYDEILEHRAAHDLPPGRSKR